MGLSPSGVLSEWGLVRVGLCPVGFCPVGLCPFTVWYIEKIVQI